MKTLKLLLACTFLVCINTELHSQINDVNTPLHALQPDYNTPYGPPSQQQVKKVLDRVYQYLNEHTASKVLYADTKKPVKNLKKLQDAIVFEEGTFRLTSYEWGVTYAGMLLASEVTGEDYFKEYSYDRLGLIADIAAYHKPSNVADSPIHSVLKPGALDDSGSLCAAMIKTKMSGFDNQNLDPVIQNLADYISNQQFRLADGTLARNRPLDNTLWLDDLFMSVPALAQMGHYTGDHKYFDDAVKQVKQFTTRMFHKQKGLYMHGWVQAMQVHPAFYWARANGWAVMTLVELLEVLPKDHQGYNFVLNQLRAHVKGLVKYQDGSGFWHQLLDKNDSYLETSATAIYTYAIARAINRGYIDALAYSPTVILAWNAVSTKVNAKGAVEGTCVGTGMAFDPAFYYFRPVNTYAAHGYGPVLLAGAEVLRMLKNYEFEINDSALILKQ